MESHYMIQTSQIFLILFIMMGPFRLLAPFGAATAGLTLNERKKLAIKSGLTALVALIIAGFVGKIILENWSIQPAVLLLSAGILFLISALPVVLKRTANVTIEKNKITAKEVALNLVISPYGLATFIVLISMSHDSQRLMSVLFCLAGVMVLDVLAMTFAKKKTEEEKSLIPRVLMTVLGTLQLALSLEIILRSLQLLEIF